MDESRRRAAGARKSAVEGCRMKIDEVKGTGVKVFNGEDDPDGNADGTAKKGVKRGQNGGSASVASNGKRKTWKSESFNGSIQTVRGKTTEEQGRELSVSVDGGIKKSPIHQVRRVRSDRGQQVSLSVDGIDKSSMQLKKGRSDGSKESSIQVSKGMSEENKNIGVSVEGKAKSPIQTRKLTSESEVQLRKVKSDSVNVASLSGEDVSFDDAIEKTSPVRLRKAKSEPDKVVDESFSGTGKKSPPEVEDSVSEEPVCQEKVISSGTETNDGAINQPPEMVVNDKDDYGDDEVVSDGDDEEFETEEEIEVEKSVDVEEINVSEEKSAMVETSVQEHKPKTVEKCGVQEHKSKKTEVSMSEQRPKTVEINLPEQKLKKVVNEEKRVHQFRNRSAPPSSPVDKRPPPVPRRTRTYENFTKPASIPHEHHNFPQPHSKLQNLVDLVMWRDISRSAFVFGVGTFVIISSSYTKDLKVSVISVISYISLVYLAAIFLYRSFICRGVVYVDDNTSYVVGEDEAIWLLELFLPYLNEFLLKLRALFSGDPATTMKMSVLLFVLARCGSYITIWKMAKLGFFGAFLVPKVCSSYSAQLSSYAEFWVRRFGDAWESCSHKKAVALGFFTLVWNLSSVVARIWAVFMMFVAVRYYRRFVEAEGWVEDEDEDEDGGVDERCHGNIGGGPERGSGISSLEVNKTKKGS